MIKDYIIYHLKKGNYKLVLNELEPYIARIIGLMVVIAIGYLILRII